MYLNTFSDNKKKYNGLKELIRFVLQNVTRVIHKNQILIYNKNQHKGTWTYESCIYIRIAGAELR